MKAIFIVAIAFTIANLANAQDHTLGKSKEQIRNLIQPNSGINLLKGQSTDTLTMNGGLQIVMYYKNDTCYSSKSILPLSLIGVMNDKIKTGYTKINDDTWLSPSGLVKVQITINKEKNQAYVETSMVNKDMKKP